MPDYVITVFDLGPWFGGAGWKENHENILFKKIGKYHQVWAKSRHAPLLSMLCIVLNFHHIFKDISHNGHKPRHFIFFLVLLISVPFLGRNKYYFRNGQKYE